VAAKVRALASSGSVAWLATVTAATAVAVYCVVDSGRGTWNRLDARYTYFSSFSTSQRAQAPADDAGLQFLGSLLHDFPEAKRGDRIYLHVPRSRYGTLDLHDTVASLVRFYLLPAVEVTDLDEATLVLSYKADPAELERTFVTQRRFGPLFVSRIAEP
jgi:hypothetical protein